MNPAQTSLHEERLERCGQLMTSADPDALLLTKPSTILYLSGDGRLCAYVMVTRWPWAYPSRASKTYHSPRRA